MCSSSTLDWNWSSDGNFWIGVEGRQVVVGLGCGKISALPSSWLIKPAGGRFGCWIFPLSGRILPKNYKCQLRWQPAPGTNRESSLPLQSSSCSPVSRYQRNKTVTVLTLLLQWWCCGCQVRPGQRASGCGVPPAGSGCRAGLGRTPAWQPIGFSRKLKIGASSGIW